MKNITKKINLIAISSVIILIIGIISSFYDFGFISVFFSVFLPVFFIINFIFLIISVIKKRYYNLIGVIIFLFCFNFFYYPRIKEGSAHATDTFSILSYNVQHFNSDKEVNTNEISSNILNFINTTNADILVLQESSYRESRKINGYTYKFLGYRKDKKKSLLALYSKYPILNTGYIDFPNTVNNAMYADIKIQKDTVRIYNLHLQSFSIKLNPTKEDNNKFTEYFKKINSSLSKQIEQAKMVKQEATNYGKNIIICGDFNSTQFSLPYRILHKGLNDSFICKGIGLGSTHSFFNYPLRLDFFLTDQRIKIINHKNFNLNLSDHEPILMKFKL